MPDLKKIMTLGVTRNGKSVTHSAITTTVMLVGLTVSGTFSQFVWAEKQAPLSIRGDVPVADSFEPDAIAEYPKRGDALPRSFIHQPPLIPHKYDYTVDLKRNGCITCHKPKMFEHQPRSSATPIHASHYRADGEIDDGYYFCRQCHVAQQSNGKSTD